MISLEGVPLDDSVRAWLREIGKTPLLSMDEEMILAQRIEREKEDPYSGEARQRPPDAGQSAAGRFHRQAV